MELAERTKELTCLIAVSRLLADRRASLSDTVTRVLEELPSGWQFPDLAVVRLAWRDTEHATEGFARTPWMMTQELVGQRGTIGVIEVAYTEHPGVEPFFLPEESQLVQAIGERIADAIELHSAEAALGTYQDQLRSLASELAITEARQRRDIAAYLHDSIGQELALVKLRLEGLRGRARDDVDNRVIDQVCDLAADVLGKTRTLMFEISPPILHELGLAPALEWLADTLRVQHGTSIEVDAEPVAIVEDDLKGLLFRSTRELLSNVFRHARATTVRVRVRAFEASIRIEVEDDGRGFDTTLVVPAGVSSGFGLFSIRERLAYMGGRLEISSTPGQGTRAVIEAPLATRRQGP